jgi:hypothetical protein
MLLLNEKGKKEHKSLQKKARINHLKLRAKNPTEI